MAANHINRYTPVKSGWDLFGRAEVSERLTVTLTDTRITHTMYGRASSIHILLIIIVAIIVPTAVFAFDVKLPGEESPQTPVFSSPFYPCSQCHATMKVNYTRRMPVAAHPDKLITGHGEPTRWCLDCHNAEDRDYLRLIGGEKVPFEETFILCSQCHGPVFKDWQYGAHGKRTGQWNGKKTFLRCPSCHDPHKPRFPQIAPSPAPTPPQESLR